MAEHGETQNGDDPLVAPAEGGTAPAAAAVALALGRTSRDKSLNAEATAYLREQTRLAQLQSEYLHEQRALQVEHLRHQDKHLRLRHFGDRLRIGLQLIGIFFGLLIAIAIGVMIWQASEDHGVAIEAFSVPPDLAARGLTGRVAASRLLDRLAELQASTVTARPASTYANDWADEIKVEIPETGVSIGELNRYLRQWLGNQTRISGEVVRTPAGLAVSARVSGTPARRSEGPEADIDRLIAQAAEGVYAQTQPYRYAVWLASAGRREEAIAAYRQLARSGAEEDRAWAYTGWATLLGQQNRYRGAARLAESALRLNPRLYPAFPVLGVSYDGLSRPEANLRRVREEIALIRSNEVIGLPKNQAVNRLRLVQGLEAMYLGDHQRAAELLRSAAGSFDLEGQAGAYTPTGLLTVVLALNHDVAASSRVWRRAGSPPGRSATFQFVMLDDWPPMASRMEQALQLTTLGDVRETLLFARAVMVFAHLGRFDEAEALAVKMPLDCYECLMAHGTLAAFKRDWPAVDRWYAEASRQAPSLPMTHTEWGNALLMKGDLDGAIVKLREAHRRGPNFADPLELWGEALMRKRDLEGAVMKFAEADEHAPRWGRNHLRWGQALAGLGRWEEARTQWRAAAGMDLSTADRARLGQVMAMRR